MQNEKKVGFILCCNNSQYQKECCSYLEELERPEGYELEILPIIGAESMTSAYNQGMGQLDAKYKVYLHQDVLIWNRHFIYDMLKIFENTKVGMIGVLGGNDIPDDGIVYRAWNMGMTYSCDTQDAGIKQGDNPEPGSFCEVEAIDGMLMATQYDVPWREDLFAGWDFYDISQSFEFRKRGYSVVVPYQKEPWCMHDCGRSKLQNYNEGRRILLEEYHTFFRNPVYREEDFYYHRELKEQYDQLRDRIIQFMQQGEMEAAVQCCGQYDDASVMDGDLSELKKLVSVCTAEEQLYGGSRTWNKGETFEIVQERYRQMKFLLWNAERGREMGKERLVDLLQQDAYSMPLAVTAGIHNTFYLQKLLPVFAEGIKRKGSLQELAYLEFIAKQIPMAEPMPFDEIRGDIQKVLSAKIEEGIAEIEEMCLNYARLRREELPEYRKRIDQLLKAGDRDGLSKLLSSKEFYHKFRTVSDMVYMVAVNQIYQEETAQHIENTVLDGRDSIDEILAFIREMKFELWRFEFGMEEEPGERFLQFIRENQVSGCMLKYAVYMAGMDKIRLLVRLAALFLNYSMPGKAFIVLKYADELCPGSEEILCTMADLCLKMGQKKEALYCLERVERPTKITAAFRKLCEV